MKKQLFLCILLFLAVGTIFADVTFKTYLGGYLGRDTEITYGADVQAGLEFGNWYYNQFVFGIYADGGVNTGLPNKPNFYYGGVAELYYWRWDIIKFGVAAGGGWNQGIESKSEKNLQSVYLRFGLPFNFIYEHFKIKAQPCFDIYPDVGMRFGFLFHLGIDVMKF